MKSIIGMLIIMALFTSCVFDEERQTEEELYSKQNKYIDTVRVKDVQVDTIRTITENIINDTNVVYDTLTIVRTTQSVDTIKSIISTTTHAYDTLHTNRYDTIIHSTLYDTTRMVISDTVVIYDTLRHITSKYDTITTYTESKGVVFDSVGNRYVPWHSVGGIKVTDWVFAPKVDTITKYPMTRISYNGSTTGYKILVDKLIDSAYKYGITWGDTSNVALVKTSPNCPSGWHAITSLEKTYLIAYSDTTYKVNNARYLTKVNASWSDTILIRTPQNVNAKINTVTGFESWVGYGTVLQDVGTNYLVNTICVFGSVKSM